MNIPHNLKGPWEVKGISDKGPYIRVRSTLVGSHFKVANVPFTSQDDHFYAVKEATEIAHLIAAAPRMLEALTKMRSFMATDVHDWSDLYIMVDSAINAATPSPLI